MSKHLPRFSVANQIAAFLFLIELCTVSWNGLNAQENEESEVAFRAMAWNIWHGGKEDGEDIGPKRVIEVIQQSGADIVAMQETYGSGERISDALEFHFHPRGINVSIHSRFPVLEDISVFEEFKCVGALIELPSEKKIAFYSIWLPYNKEIWAEGTRDTSDPNSMLAACQASCDDLKVIQTEIAKRLSDPKYEGIPIVVAGDFNSMSHLDYVEEAKDQYGVVIDWPTSRVMTKNGFTDSWREARPEINREKDRTWTPRFPAQQQDRIDFVYYSGLLRTVESTIIDSHEIKFPSDHAAVVSAFRWQEEAEKE